MHVVRNMGGVDTPNRIVWVCHCPDTDTVWIIARNTVLKFSQLSSMAARSKLVGLL